MGTFFLDYENGNDNFGGTSFNTLASGADGRINGNVFSAVTANFPNDNTIAGSKNLLGSVDRFDNSGITSWLRVSGLPANISPPTSGLSTTWLITEDTSNNTHFLQINGNTYSLNTALQYTASFYIKSNGVNQVNLQLGNSDTRAARFNIGTGIVEQIGANASANIQNIGDGWYRITITAIPLTSTDFIYLSLTNNNHTGTGGQSYLGGGINGIYISSPQLELGSSATTFQESPYQYLSIWNGTSYVVYLITSYINSTTLRITSIVGGTALANQTVDRQYYIGGRWKTFDNGAPAARTLPGETFRIMASPDPTLVGSATFVSNKQNPYKGINSTANTTPISVTCNGHGYSTGDTVVITGITTNSNVNGTWEITVTGTNTFTLNDSTGTGATTGGSVKKINNCVVRLSSPVTANIASFGNVGSGRVSWTSANANNTVNFSTTDYKEGSVSDQIAIGAGFTTGKAAYFPVSNLDLSGYQQVSFYLKQTAGTAIVANNISLALCSDSLGNTVVNTINIPGISLINRWLPITVNLGTNLGSTINSIALYVNVDNGSQTFLFSNIIACKASSSPDSLNLQSLVGKNTSSEKWWGPIQSINGTRLILDQDPQMLPINSTNQMRGYFGTSETTSLYKRETIKTVPSVSNNNFTQTVTADSGYEFFPTKLQFGYDRTNMSSRTGETFFDGLNSIGVGFWCPNRNYIEISNAGFFRYDSGIRPQTVYFLNMSNIWLGGNLSQPIYVYNVYKSIFTNFYTFFNTGSGFYLGVSSSSNTASNIYSNCNGGTGIYQDYCPNFILFDSVCNNNIAGIGLAHTITSLVKNCIFTNNQNQGMGTLSSGSHNNLFLNCTTSDNSYSVLTSGHGTNYVKNCTLNENIEYSGPIPYVNARTIFIDNDGSTNNYLHVTDYGTIYNTAVVRYSNSGFAWALAPTNINRNSSYPLDLSIAKIAVNANALVTVKAWMRRTNTLLSAGLRIKGGQIAGVVNDITSYMTAAADTWQQITLTFTPTEVGVVEILAECYGGTTYTAYVDDLSITQV